ncbi:tetratricopeptide repeat protein [Desulfogranum marinum]|uniref:tetratricopeptide repeat protein n=1 Tax=Desulfogranum marinum TaxID=453220 RepID=UPI0029C843BE|nr:tetratricopeptide repeat protein [Desulfogranum marinum]
MKISRATSIIIVKQLTSVCIAVSIVFVAVHAFALTAQEQYERARQFHEQGNDVQGCAWLEKAANQGHRDAQNKIGVCYQNGYGGTKSLQKAAYWYAKAAELGDYSSMSNLAGMLASGDGVPRDCRRAEQYFRRSADQIGQSSFGLGLMYQQGCDSVAPNISQMAKYFEKSAEQGYSDGQSNIAYLYANGRGVPKNFEKACYWATVASLQGNRQGLANADVFCAQLSSGHAADAKRRAEQFGMGGTSLGQAPAQSYSAAETSTPASGGSSFKRRWKKAE